MIEAKANTGLPVAGYTNQSDEKVALVNTNKALEERVLRQLDKLKRELVEVMVRCSSEIKGLRSTIDRLAPKADAYDNLVIVLGLPPQRPQGMGEDLAWKLDRRIEELKKDESDAH